jgi:hypothetical protein
MYKLYTFFNFSLKTVYRLILQDTCLQVDITREPLSRMAEKKSSSDLSFYCLSLKHSLHVDITRDLSIG